MYNETCGLVNITVMRNETTMDVLFFNNIDRRMFSGWSEITEDLLLGGGRISKLQIIDLLRCLDLNVETVSENLWKLTAISTEKFATINDETLKDAGVTWSECESWAGVDVNAMDLAGHLLEIKYSYINQSNPTDIWLLFE